MIARFMFFISSRATIKRDQLTNVATGHIRPKGWHTTALDKGRCSRSCLVHDIQPTVEQRGIIEHQMRGNCHWVIPCQFETTACLDNLNNNSDIRRSE